ncbi:hypothetical protein HY311_02230 [Candidatus Nomurabacteria bacterium]|nr:hypothetical protein [Candidatus Nomurabacteria bacterium]
MSDEERKRLLAEMKQGEPAEKLAGLSREEIRERLILEAMAGERMSRQDAEVSIDNAMEEDGDEGNPEDALNQREE